MGMRDPQVWFDYDTRRVFVVQTEVTLPPLLEDAPNDEIAESCPMEVRMKGEKEEMLTYKWFQKHPDELGQGVTGIRLEDGELLSTSDEPSISIGVLRKQVFARYPTLAEARLPGHLAKTILRSELVELDRLWRNVDLVSFTNEAGETEKAVFKYFTDIGRARHQWAEHKLLLHLPPHPLLPCTPGPSSKRARATW
ncbi:hypothetical protein B0H63DRAFT_65809 [Podospora didyma]|uniref:Uncharacterized protein n=1 Tax=Podospora didyma TaxID=330526 RepID=A0AAE0P8D2_9PEZI|nr:hypothetical protein B0H63DRAFT_65809 [Podospora didyma]